MYPDRFRVDATVPGVDEPLVQVYNAGEAWVKDPKGVREAPALMRDDFAANVRRDTIPLLVAASRGDLSTRLVPDGETSRDGGDDVLEISGSGLMPVRLYIDDDGLIAKQAFTSAGPDGRRLPTEEVFSDYRVVNGVRVPFEATLMRNGRPVVKRSLDRVVINGPVDASLFEKPR